MIQQYVADLERLETFLYDILETFKNHSGYIDEGELVWAIGFINKIKCDIQYKGER